MAKATKDSRAQADTYGGKRGADAPRRQEREPWKPEHREPPRGYGNLDGVCLEDPDPLAPVTEEDRMAWPGDDPKPRSSDRY